MHFFPMFDSDSPLNILENLWFSDAFRGNQNQTMGRHALKNYEKKYYIIKENFQRESKGEIGKKWTKLKYVFTQKSCFSEDILSISLLSLPRNKTFD